MNEVIESRLGNADIIEEEAQKVGLSLALACALVEQESGGRNIFGCDYGDVGDTPPYCGQEVTKHRVQKLRANDYYYGMNGVGLTQLTWWEFVEEAEELGGAHLPRNQCAVGFKLMNSYADKYENFLEALACYNAGEANRFSVIDTYAAQLYEKYLTWKELLAETPEYPQILLSEDKATWVVDAHNNWARLAPNQDLKTDGDGWLYVVKSVTPEFTWPDAQDDPVDGGYQDRHPTRYNWRPDVEEWARYLVQNYNVWCNTYYEHPEGWGFQDRGDGWYTQNTSIDVWGPGGRNDPIDMSLGDEIFKLLFNYEGAPNIDWIIWRRYIYMASNNWQGEYFGDGSIFTNHEDHIHVTYH